ncbi:MAG: hypothetical protein R2860_04325 [Desulfobacterales bacterium]
MLGQDTAVELGNPKNMIQNFSGMGKRPAVIKNGRISLVGPDLGTFRTAGVFQPKS